MGLDMYLYKKMSIGGQWADNKEDVITIRKNNGNREIKIKIKDIDEIETEVLYWRKNYAINEWFLDKVGDGGDDNCRYFNVCYEDLEELRDILKEIISAKSKKEKLRIAQEKLNTDDLEEYINEYLEDFERTYKELDKIINAPDFKNYDYYYYIWY